MKYNLFLVQDADRPVYVVASTFDEAIKRWTFLMSEENDCMPSEVGRPTGVQFVADGDLGELLLPDAS